LLYRKFLFSLYSETYMEEIVHKNPSEVFMFNPNDTARATPYYVGVDPVSFLKFF